MNISYWSEFFIYPLFCWLLITILLHFNLECCTNIFQIIGVINIYSFNKIQFLSILKTVKSGSLLSWLLSFLPTFWQHWVFFCTSYFIIKQGKYNFCVVYGCNLKLHIHSLKNIFWIMILKLTRGMIGIFNMSFYFYISKSLLLPMYKCFLLIRHIFWI